MNDQDILIEKAKIIAQQRLLIEVIEDTKRVATSALNAKYLSRYDELTEQYEKLNQIESIN